MNLLPALLTGKIDNLPDETTYLFARAGLLFLFSAAGVHLRAAAVVADSLSLPLRRFLPSGKPREIALFGTRCTLTIWLVGEVGGSAPLVRGAVMGSLIALARVLELDSDRLWILLLSLLVSALLGRNTPLSFAMSACALAGALYGKPRVLGSWLFTLPLTIWEWGLISLLGPLWTLLASPFLSWILLPLAIFARLGNELGFPLAPLDSASTFLADTFEKALQLGVNATGGAVWICPLPWLFLTIGLLASYKVWHHRPRRGALLALSSVIFCELLPLPSFSALNVGQGDGIYFRTSHQELLEDVGPPGLHGRPAPVCQSLEKLGRGSLDEILLSHFDLDHRGGLDSLLARHPVRGSLWFREEDLSTKNHEKVILAAERAGVPIRFLRDDRSPEDIRCWLAPFRDGNDSSPLCRVILQGRATLLLTGDMSEKAEKWYLHALSSFPEAEILKVAHHGSRTSSSDAFLGATGSTTAVISVGAHNRYHHPSPETLERLTLAGLHVRRTDLEGSVNIYAWDLSYWASKLFTEEIIRPSPSAGSRTYPGSPATAR